MASPADLLRLFFVNTGIAIPASQTPTAGQFQVVTDSLPKEGDNYLAIQDTGGYIQGRIHRDGRTILFPRITISVRSINYPTGMDKGRQIQAVLEKVGLPVASGGIWRPQFAINTTGVWVLVAAHLTVPITKIAEEEANRRQLFTINYQLTVEAPLVDLSGLHV